MFIYPKKLKTLNKIFNLLKKNPDSKNEINKYMNIDVTSLQVAEAFAKSMLKNYPVIPNNWKKINRNVAGKMLEEYMSINTFKKYVDLNYFRHDSEKNVYEEEIKKYQDSARTVYNLYDIFFKKENEAGIEKIVMYPSSITKQGLSEHNQTMRAALHLFKQDWFVDLIKNLDTTS